MLSKKSVGNKLAHDLISASSTRCGEKVESRATRERLKVKQPENKTMTEMTAAKVYESKDAKEIT